MVQNLYEIEKITMITVFYIILLILALTHGIYILCAFIIPKKNNECINDNKYSIEHIVCFKNESKFIEKKMKNCYEIDYPCIHHTFINDNSTDNTWELLNRYKQEKTTLVNNTEDLGKNRSQIQSVAQTKADLLLFTDANVFLNPDAVKCLVASLDAHVVGVCGNVTVTTDLKHHDQDLSGRYWELEKTIKNFQSHFGSVIGFDGGFYCLKREYYYIKEKNELSDFETTFLIFKHGKQTKYVDSAVAMELESRKLKNSFLARIRASNRTFWSFRRIFKYIKKLSPSALFHFAIHKLIRYLLIIMFVLSLPFIIIDLFKISPLFLLIFIIPHVYRFTIESIALCIGGGMALAGKEYTTWSNRKI